MKSLDFVALILAAGFSSRMRQFKPLLPLGNETITDRVISLFKNNGIAVYLVVGWRSSELLAGIKTHNITVIENPDYSSGMFSSVRAGIRHLPPDIAGFFIMPVDIPLVRTATIKQLLSIANHNSNRIIYPTFNGCRGHPTVIPSSLVPEILKWPGAGGLKTILDSHPDLHLEFPVADSGTIFDVDSPQDNAALLERFRCYDIPNDAEYHAMLDIAGTPENIRRHCRRVAAIAVTIAASLVQTGQQVDTDSVRYAALLHDITRTTPDHAAAGDRILREIGFSRIADIVARHTDLAQSSTATIEDKIVFLSDKFVSDENIVTLQERYSLANSKYTKTSDITAKIQNSLQLAQRVKNEIEFLLGFSLDNIIKKIP